MCAGTEKNVPCSEYRPVVLIAQSDEEDLKTVQTAARSYDKFDVVTTTTGQGIIDNVNKYCFDAIVLGLKFPDITGATVAYLVHQFDPLISVGFLSVYKSSIIITMAQDLNCRFWDKNEKFTDLPSLCDDIYNLAMEMPCDNKSRIIKRAYMKPAREEYLKYGKLEVPDSIAQVVQMRKEAV